MKTVLFEGAQYEVPDYVNYIVRDADGFVGGHEDKPWRFYSICEWVSSKRSFAAEAIERAVWSSTLTEV